MALAQQYVRDLQRGRLYRINDEIVQVKRQVKEYPKYLLFYGCKERNYPLSEDDLPGLLASYHAAVERLARLVQEREELKRAMRQS